MSLEYHVLQLKGQIIDHYKHEARKALLAIALVLWRDRPASEIIKHIDPETAKHLAAIVDDPTGPVFYRKEDDRFHLRRWARRLLEEGVLARKFTTAEEEQLYRDVIQRAQETGDDELTNGSLRELAQMGDSDSASTICSDLLKRWVVAKRVRPIGNGRRYKLIDRTAVASSDSLWQAIMEAVGSSNMEATPITLKDFDWSAIMRIDPPKKE
jgi:hypothetical protein